MIKKLVVFVISLIVSLLAIYHLYISISNSKIVNPNAILNTTKKNLSSPTLQQEPVLPKITLDDIFKNNIDLSNFDKKYLTTVVATGDFIPARSVNFNVLKYNDFNWTTNNVKSYFTNTDIVFVNLEAPLLSNCPITVEGFVFCGDKRNTEALKNINTNIVNLANNHFHNYGLSGIEESQKLLRENNIKYTGANNLQIIEKNGVKFGFLGYNDIGYTPEQISKAENTKIISDIKEAKEKCNVLLVQFHFGAEYNYFPDSRQKELAHLAVDNGADLIIGNHPHTIQPVEIYKNKLIMYAHGNFVFDQMWSEQTKKGVVGFYTFYKNNLVKVEYKPVYITDFGKANIPNTEISKDILGKLEEISYEWGRKNTDVR